MGRTVTSLLALALLGALLTACQSDDDEAPATAEATSAVEATATADATGTTAATVEPTAAQAALATATATACSGELAASGQPSTGPLAVTAAVDGSTVEGLLHVPASYDNAEPLPLLLLFHGGGGSPESILRSSNMAATADAHGFLVLAAPNGLAPPVGALLDRVQATHCVDATRVYAAGLSAGARITSGIACSLPGRVAAIAPVAGAQFAAIPCADYGPLPVVAVHGSEDLIVPYSGATLAVDGWIRHNGCSESAVEALNGLVSLERYGGCDGGVEVVLIAVEGGGHQWFTQPVEDPDGGPAVDLNEQIWAELARYSIGGETP